MKAALTLLCCGLLTGCAVGSGGTSCDLGSKLTVSPATATADHSAAPPGNEVQFMSVVAPTAPPGCAVPQWLLQATPTWTSTDSKDIQIDSSTNAQTNGLATCSGATNGAATLTATVTFDNTVLTQTASLTCK